MDKRNKEIVDFWLQRVKPYNMTRLHSHFRDNKKLPSVLSSDVWQHFPVEVWTSPVRGLKYNNGFASDEGNKEASILAYLLFQSETPEIDLIPFEKIWHKIPIDFFFETPYDSNNLSLLHALATLGYIDRLSDEQRKSIPATEWYRNFDPDDMNDEYSFTPLHIVVMMGDTAYIPEEILRNIEFSFWLRKVSDFYKFPVLIALIPQKEFCQLITAKDIATLNKQFFINLPLQDKTPTNLTDKYPFSHWNIPDSSLLRLFQYDVWKNRIDELSETRKAWLSYSQDDIKMPFDRALFIQLTDVILLKASQQKKKRLSQNKHKPK